MRLIDADKFKTFLQQLKRAGAQAHDIDDIVKLVNKQPTAEYNNGWIPVSKCLPEEPEIIIDREYDIQSAAECDVIKEYIVMMAGAEMPTTLFYAGNGNWVDYITECFYKVTAWQPLPEPWKPVVEESDVEEVLT